MTYIYKLSLFVAGIIFLVLTIQMYRKEWKAPTWICAILTLLALLGTQEWVQGFFKTGVLGLGVKYGEQLNSFQTTVGQIEETVQSHQRTLDLHQNDIDAQQAQVKQDQANVRKLQDQIVKQQTTLAAQQADTRTQQAEISKTSKQLSEALLTLSEQQKRLGDMETLIDNIYTRTRTDRFSSANSNRFCFAVRASNALWGVFLMSAAPVPNSIQGYYGNMPLKPGMISVANVVAAILTGKESDWTGDGFIFSYVADPRNTNLLTNITQKDGEAYCDGVRLPFPKE